MNWIHKYNYYKIFNNITLIKKTKKCLVCYCWLAEYGLHSVSSSLNLAFINLACYYIGCVSIKCNCVTVLPSLHCAMVAEIKLKHSSYTCRYLEGHKPRQESSRALCPVLPSPAIAMSFLFSACLTVGPTILCFWN